MKVAFYNAQPFELLTFLEFSAHIATPQNGSKEEECSFYNFPEERRSNSSRHSNILALYHIFSKNGLTKICSMHMVFLQCDIDAPLSGGVISVSHFLNQSGALELSQPIECGGDGAM